MQNFPPAVAVGVPLPGRQIPGMEFASPQGRVHGVPGNGTPTDTESWREIPNEATAPYFV